MICTQCGATKLKEEGTYFLCPYCGTKYSLSRKAKSTSCTSSVNASVHGISLESDIDRLLQKCKIDPQNAKRYANLILDIDPNNQEAKRILEAQNEYRRNRYSIWN